MICEGRELCGEGSAVLGECGICVVREVKFLVRGSFVVTGNVVLDEGGDCVVRGVSFTVRRTLV